MSQDLSGSPLSRRYQVFVSSTYDDLIDERRHVMQALLETKCIPSGMELFPAASTSQMEMIERLIDDCDYYLVLVAGRYGSISAKGLSYTEMEYDYATSIGKPVIGFYHNDVRELPGKHLEREDHRRHALEKFIEKVKSGLCRSWSTPEGLGSAIKSAILNEIEFNPQSGWVRANSQVSPGMVLRLKQRIADLEETLARKSDAKGDSFPSDHEELSAEFDLSYELPETEGKKGWRYYNRSKVINSSFKVDDLFLPVAKHLQKGNSKRASLKKVLDNALASKLQPIGSVELNPGEAFSSCKVNSVYFEKLLNTFVAKGYLQRAAPPKISNSKEKYWSLTSRGSRRLSELVALKK